MGRVKVTRSSRIPKISAEAKVRARAVVVKTVADIKADAKADAPVDQRDIQKSIQGRTEKDLQGEVFTEQWDAMFPEFGTVKAAAQPYLTPAAEKNREPFTQAMKRIVD